MIWYGSFYFVGVPDMTPLIRVGSAQRLDEKYDFTVCFSHKNGSDDGRSQRGLGGVM